MFSWYKYLIVNLVFSHLSLFDRESFSDWPSPDLCLLVLFLNLVFRIDADLFLGRSMRSQEEGVQWKEEYEKCAEKLKQLEILSKDGELIPPPPPPYDMNLGAKGSVLQELWDFLNLYIECLP